MAVNPEVLDTLSDWMTYSTWQTIADFHWTICKNVFNDDHIFNE